MVRAKKDETGSTTSKTQKDPNNIAKKKPKKALSAYFIWFMETRHSLTEKGMSVVDVSRKAGALWRGMSAEEKEPWEEKAAEDKERHNREMAAFTNREVTLITFGAGARK